MEWRNVFLLSLFRSDCANNNLAIDEYDEDHISNKGGIEADGNHH